MTIQPTPFVMLRLLQDQYRTMGKMIEMLEGMLDHSAPDPFLTAGPADTDVIPIPPPVLKRKTGESARPPVLFMLDGQQIKTTERRVKLLRVLQGDPLTYEEMVKAGAVPTRDAAKQAVIDINASLVRAGANRRIYAAAKPAQRIGARGGREPARFALLPWPPKPEIATPGPFTAAQSEAAAGSTPEQAASVSAAEDGDTILSAQHVEFVTQAGTEEGRQGDFPSEPDIAPAADEELPETAVGTGECASRSVGEGEEPAGAAPDLVKPSAKPDGGYSVDPEAQKDSVDRTGRRNGVVGRDGAAAAAEHGPKPGQIIVSGQEKVLNLWSSTNMTKAEIAAFAKVQVTTVRSILSTARQAGDARAVADDQRPKSASPPAAAVSANVQPIEPGDLISVDVKMRRVTTSAHGGYETGTTILARALDKLKGGQLFGIDVIAKVAGWPNVDTARTALGFERNRLADHGLELWMDKFNVRLRSGA